MSSTQESLTSVSPMIGSGGAIGKLAQCDSFVTSLSTIASAKPRRFDDDDGGEPQTHMSRFDCRFTDTDGVDTEADARREGEVLRAAAVAGSLRLSACAA